MPDIGEYSFLFHEEGDGEGKKTHLDGILPDIGHCILVIVALTLIPDPDP